MGSCVYFVVFSIIFSKPQNPSDDKHGCAYEIMKQDCYQKEVEGF